MYEKSKGRLDLQRSRRDKKKEKQDQRRKGLYLLYLEETPILFIQIRHLKMDQGPRNHWGKDQDNQLNVGDVEETIWLKTSHSKEVEQ